MDKFHVEKFNPWKFKMEMVLAFIDLWDIVDGSEKALSSDADPKVLKDYQIHIKKTISIIGLNLVDNQFAHIKSCKELGEVWKILYNIYKMKNLSNILLDYRLGDDADKGVDDEINNDMFDA